MGNRIIKESICISDSINRLTWFEECFFYRLIVNVDDYGILDGRIPVIKSKLFPLKANITEKQIVDTLSKLASAGIVSLETYEQKPYLQITAWAKHQQIRSKTSKYVPLDDNGIPSFDINCNQMISNDCLIQSNTIQSESNPNPIQSSQKEREKESEKSFEKFWEAYPKKANRKEALKAWNKIKNVDDSFVEMLLEKIELLKRTRQWQEYQYVPYPATWLNREQWNDEIGGGTYGQNISGDRKNPNSVADTSSSGAVSPYGKTV